MGHDVFTFYHLSKWELNAGLVEIKNQPIEDEVIKASKIREMQVYRDFVNLDHVFFCEQPSLSQISLPKKIGLDKDVLKNEQYKCRCNSNYISTEWLGTNSLFA